MICQHVGFSFENSAETFLDRRLKLQRWMSWKKLNNFLEVIISAKRLYWKKQLSAKGSYEHVEKFWHPGRSFLDETPKNYLTMSNNDLQNLRKIFAGTKLFARRRKVMEINLFLFQKKLIFVKALPWTRRVQLRRAGWKNFGKGRQFTAECPKKLERLFFKKLVRQNVSFK